MKEEEVAVVGNEDDFVVFPVAGDLAAVGGFGDVVIGGFGFDDAAGVAGLGFGEAEVGVAGAGVGQFVGGGDGGVEALADGIEEVFVGGAVGEFGGVALVAVDFVEAVEILGDESGGGLLRHEKHDNGWGEGGQAGDEEGGEWPRGGGEGVVMIR